MAKFAKIALTISIIILVALGGFFGYQGYLDWGINSKVSDNNEAKMFTVNKGDNVTEIAKNLEDASLIRKAAFFEKYAENHQLGDKMKAGRFLLKPNMTPQQIADLIASGKTDENIVTIPEGFNKKQIAAKLALEKIITESEFLSAIKKNDFDYDFLKDKPSSVDLEGYLFPDTYYLEPGAKADEVIKKMLDNFNRKLDDNLRKEIKKQGKTIFETLILASLVEKEVANASDRPIVAGIFLNRLHLGMHLSSCATIQYILNTNQQRFSYAQTRVESPYNTYIHFGLPPTPIGNPGLDAIKAAIYPKDTNYLYFLSDDEGVTHYATTYKQHEANKAKYLD